MRLRSCGLGPSYVVVVCLIVSIVNFSDMPPCAVCLIVRSCLILSQVVVVRGKRFTVCQSPFLDAHGEEDVDLVRGRPLYLNAAGYDQLSALFCAGGLDFDSSTLHNAQPVISDF